MLTNTDNTPWFAATLFYTKLKETEEFLNNNSIETFIPKTWTVLVDKEGKKKRKLKPIVSNLIFIKKQVSYNDLQTLLDKLSFFVHIITATRESNTPYEISATEMKEFIIMCNPDISMREFLSEEQAHLKTGTKVYVTNGPLKGLNGKLVRKNKKYFLLKEVPGMAVMVKVARWCCKAIDE